MIVFESLNDFAKAHSEWLREFRESSPPVLEEGKANEILQEVIRLYESRVVDFEEARTILLASGVYVDPQFEVKDWCVDPRPMFMGAAGLRKIKARWVCPDEVVMTETEKKDLVPLLETARAAAYDCWQAATKVRRSDDPDLDYLDTKVREGTFAAYELMNRVVKEARVAILASAASDLYKRVRRVLRCSGRMELTCPIVSEADVIGLERETFDGYAVGDRVELTETFKIFRPTDFVPVDGPPKGTQGTLTEFLTKDMCMVELVVPIPNETEEGKPLPRVMIGLDKLRRVP